MSDSTEEHGKNAKAYRIHVNGTDREVDHEVLSFEEVVALAFTTPEPTTIYSVTFTKASVPKQGELLAGQSVTIKNNTEFDVDDTGRS